MTRRRQDPREAGNLQRLRLLVSDTAVYGLASAVSKSFALILFPLLTRSMSIADYGRLDLALYAATLFGLVMIWGLDSAVARLFFEDEDHEERRQTISQALAIVLANCGLMIAATVAVAWWAMPEEYDSPQTWQVLALLLLFAPVSGLLSFCQSLLKWTFQRDRYILIALGMPATNLLLLLALSRLPSFEPVIAVAAMTGVATLFAATALVMIRQWITIPRGTLAMRRLVPLALPYGLIAAISALSPLVERAVVAGRFGPVELGLYAAAAKLASIATMLAIAFQMGWGPFAYSLYKEDGAARTYNLVLRAFAAIMCVAVLALSAAADPLARFLAGDSYRGASLFVFPLAMTLGLQAIGWITEIGIHLSKKTYLNLIGFAAFLAISLAGILVLSRSIGMIGVPLGAMLGQLAMLIISAIMAQKVFPIAWQFALPATTIAVTLASGLAALGANLADNGAQPHWFFIGGIVAVLGINVALGTRASDWRRARELLAAMAQTAPRG